VFKLSSIFVFVSVQIRGVSFMSFSLGLGIAEVLATFEMIFGLCFLRLRCNNASAIVVLDHDDGYMVSWGFFG